MKKRKHTTATGSFLAAGISGLLAGAVLTGFTVLAAPVYTEPPEGMSQERFAALNDAVIAWDELGDLVQYWNPTYTRVYGSARQSAEEMEAGYGDFYDEMQDMLDEADEGIDEIKAAQELITSLPGEMVPYGGAVVPKSAALSALEASLDAAKAGRSQIRAGLHSASRSVDKIGKSIDNNKQLRLVREQLTGVVQGLVISYKQLQVNREMVAKQVELYTSLLKLQQNMQAQQMATAADVAAYQNRLLAAQQSLQQIDNGLWQLQKNIALQCGYQAGTEVVIGDLPAPDGDFLSKRDYAADRATAINANAAVQDADRLANYTKVGGTNTLREMSMNEIAGKAGAKMDELRTEVEKQQLLYRTSAVSLERAALARDGAERQYSLGLLGRSEYEARQMEYISYEASARLTALNLQQAICNYEWAVRGIMSIE